MRPVVAQVANIQNLHAAFNAVADRPPGTPGICLVHGFAGAGKTTGTSWLVNQVHGVYLRSRSVWTPSSMLAALATELGAVVQGSSNADRLDAIEASLAANPRPLFVDEADHLTGRRVLLEALRDIHDITHVPLVIVGMDGIDKKIARFQQLSSRVAHQVEFRPLSIRDAAVVAGAVCEVKVTPDLLTRLHGAAKGSVRLVTVGLGRVEDFARNANMDEVDAAAWGDRAFFTGHAPHLRG